MKLSLCNEVIRELPFAGQCELAASLGYQGLEVAPFTICEDPRDLTATEISEIRRAAEAAGVRISGLHWLLVTPQGLSITSTDNAIHAQTVEIMRRCIEICAELGGDAMVHGSPAQRRLSEDPATAAIERAQAYEAFAAIAPAAEAAGVYYCQEALAPEESNFINSVAEAAAIVDRIASPKVRTMIDCCAAGKAEEFTIADLIDTWLPSGHVAHIQVNDRNHRGPGQGDDDFRPVLAALQRHGYTGWIAAEPFIYEPDGPTTAAEMADYLRGILGELGSPLQI